MHYNPNNYLCGRLYGGNEEMNKFIETYLIPNSIIVDNKTHEPLEPITLTMILEDGLLQFFSRQPILQREYWIQIRPLAHFGYWRSKNIISMKDVYDGLLDFGFKETK